MRFLLLLAFFLVSTVAQASSVSCPKKVSDVSLDEGRPYVDVIDGHELIMHGGIEPDIGGDYDGNASQVEWNELNYSDEATPVIAHCYETEDHKNSSDIKVPYAIKRCTLRNHEFSCNSDTIACQGYVGSVTIEAVSSKGMHRIVKPTAIKSDRYGGKEWDDLEIEQNEKLFAICLPDILPNIISYMPMSIPSEMKKCRFKNKRFICSTTKEE